MDWAHESRMLSRQQYDLVVQKARGFLNKHLNCSLKKDTTLECYGLLVTQNISGGESIMHQAIAKGLYEKEYGIRWGPAVR